MPVARHFESVAFHSKIRSHFEFAVVGSIAAVMSVPKANATFHVTTRPPVPSCSIRIVSVWPSTGEPEGAAIVIAPVSAAMFNTSVVPALGVTVAAYATEVVLTIAGGVGSAGIPCLWSRRAAKAIAPTAAASPKACVTGAVASNAAIVSLDRIGVVAAPAAAAVPRTTALVANDSRPCTWSRRADLAMDPTAAASPTADVVGAVASNKAIVASVATAVPVLPATLVVPNVYAGAPKLVPPPDEPTPIVELRFHVVPPVYVNVAPQNCATIVHVGSP